MVLPAVDKIWMDGELVDWDKAQVHVLTHALHYGSGVFEGIRCYSTAEGPAVFRLREHMERLERSAKMLFMDIGYTVDEMVEAVKDTIRVNNLPACHIRPIASIKGARMCCSSPVCPTSTTARSRRLSKPSASRLFVAAIASSKYAWAGLG